MLGAMPRALLPALLATGLLAAEPPNVLVVLADDLGWGDPACQGTGSLVPTPAMDRLAAEGRRFTDAYCPCSVCTPSRYALLTGREPWRTRAKPGVLANWEGPMIAPGLATLPGHLRQAGYATAGFGKWHLGATWTTRDGRPPEGLGVFGGRGGNLDIAAPVAGGPCDRGFERWWGVLCSSEQLIVDDRRIAGLLTQEKYAPPPPAAQLPARDTAAFLGEVFDRGVEWIGRRHARPWLLYLAPYAPHIPLTPPHAFRGTTRAGDYGDYVRALDHHLGRVLEALDAAGAAGSTLVIFASDNGSQFQTTGEGHRPNGGLRGGKWTPYEGGVRTPLLVRWPGRVPAGSSSPAVVALTDLLPTIGAAVGRPLPVDAGLDGVSFLPALTGTGPARTRIVTRASEGGVFAVREGSWKLVARPGKSELYDLAADAEESADRAAERPELVARLLAAVPRP